MPQVAEGDRKQRFTAPLHHVYDGEHLRTAYHAMKRDAAAGIDGETWGTAATAKCKDSGALNFARGNPFSIIGT